MPKPADPVIIKRYGRDRLYAPAQAAYVTLDDLAAMVEDDEAFFVTEAASGKDITSSLLRQIISGRGKHG